MTRLYLAGLSGSGKSEVARRIGAWLDMKVLDVDGEVEHAAGETIPELWERGGESAFRRAEREALSRLLETEGPAVLALGGGTLEEPGNRARLERWGEGVWLDAPPEVLADRVSGEAGTRPLLAGEDPVRALRRMAEERGPRYRALEHRVPTGGRPLAAVAVDVLRLLEWPAPEPVADGVWLGRDALAHAGPVVAGETGGPAGPVVVATDERVWTLHGAALAGGVANREFEVAPCVLPAGEAAKGIDPLARLWRALVDAGADRDTPLAVLGGGAAGDVGGLAAATFKRGLPLILFPTTLLAQVDAAIGGKNAIDFAGVKNLVGTFHFPAAVVSDPLCLLTLEERDWRAGWAEVVKTALIGDPVLFRLCEEEAEAIAGRRLGVVEEAVARAAAVKARVVAADPREAGKRRVLNLGHTLGHAVEAASGGALLHGEAVAIGLVAGARLAEAEGVAEAGLAGRIERALRGLDLPTRVPAGLAAEDLTGHVRHDKKRAGGALHQVLPVSVGEVVVRPVEEATLEGWITDLVAGAEAPAGGAR